MNAPFLDPANNPPQNFNTQPPVQAHPGMAQGEADRQVLQIPDAVILRYFKKTLICTSTRFEYIAPKKIFGLIPAGEYKQSVPLNNIAEVSYYTTHFFARLLFGILALLLGLSTLFVFPPIGVLLILGGLSLIMNWKMANLSIKHSGGTSIFISTNTEHAIKLKRFGDSLNDRLFSDRSQIRHEESMDLQYAQLQAQQAMLQQQLAFYQSLMQGQAPGQMGAGATQQAPAFAPNPSPQMYQAPVEPHQPPHPGYFQPHYQPAPPHGADVAQPFVQPMAQPMAQPAPQPMSQPVTQPAFTPEPSVDAIQSETQPEMPTFDPGSMASPEPMFAEPTVSTADDPVNPFAVTVIDDPVQSAPAETATIPDVAPGLTQAESTLPPPSVSPSTPELAREPTVQLPQPPTRFLVPSA